jgi:hypothetical protein
MSTKCFPVPDAGSVTPVQEFRQVALIVYAGVGGKPAFRLQVVQKSVDPVL